MRADLETEKLNEMGAHDAYDASADYRLSRLHDSVSIEDDKGNTRHMRHCFPEARANSGPEELNQKIFHLYRPPLRESCLAGTGAACRKN
jgi:hypothetical protein